MPSTTLWDDDAAFEAQIAPTRDALGGLIKASRSLAEERGRLPSAESYAIAERNEGDVIKAPPPWDKYPASAAQEVAGVILFAAEDNALAMVRVLESDPVSVFAHIVLARACLENASRAWWMLEPAIGVRRRIARRVNERLESLTELSRFPLSADFKQEAHEKAAALVAVSEDVGFGKLPSRRNHPPEIVERRPSKTELVKGLLADKRDTTIGDVVYRYSSAVTHGLMAGLGLSLASGWPRPPKGVGEAWAAIHTSSADVVNIMTAVVVGFGRASIRRNELFGWGSPAWDAAWAAALRPIRGT
jgi:hypothetical protein